MPLGRPLRAAGWKAGGLASDGVSLELAQRTGLPTTLALAELDGSRRGASLLSRGTAQPPPPWPQTASWGCCRRGTRALHVGTLGLVLEPIARTTLVAVVDALPEDVLLLVDPNCRPSGIVRTPRRTGRG